MNPGIFSQMHIVPNSDHLKEMLDVIWVDSMDELIDQTVPNNIRLQTNLNLDLPLSEQEFLEHIHELGSKNKVFKSYIRMGYNPSNLPAVIQRNILENPCV